MLFGGVCVCVCVCVCVFVEGGRVGVEEETVTHTLLEFKVLQGLKAHS